MLKLLASKPKKTMNILVKFFQFIHRAVLVLVGGFMLIIGILIGILIEKIL